MVNHFLLFQLALLSQDGGEAGFLTVSYSYSLAFPPLPLVIISSCYVPPSPRPLIQCTMCLFATSSGITPECTHICTNNNYEVVNILSHISTFQKQIYSILSLSDKHNSD